MPLILSLVYLVPGIHRAMYGIYLSASGAHAYDNYLNIVANNIANSDTPGFKKELAIIEAVDSQEIQDGTDYRGSRSINDVGGGTQCIGQ